MEFIRGHFLCVLTINVESATETTRRLNGHLSMMKTTKCEKLSEYESFSSCINHGTFQEAPSLT